MPIDRDAAIRTAEKLLRQGKLEAAIGQYVRLIDEYPSDWAAVTTLGDLYVRAGQRDRAAEQFVRVADHRYSEGALQDAAAAYAKILKLRTDDEHALVRLADVGAQQGRLDDTRTHLGQLVALRQARGDDRGAAEGLIQLARLDEDDGPARMTAAHAAQAIGLTSQALTLYEEAASAFERLGQQADALEAWVAAADLAPQEQSLRAKVVRLLLDAGQVERAEAYLTRETAGGDPDLLVAVARGHLRAGRVADAQPVLMRALAAAPDRHGVVERLADELVSAGRIDEGYACVEVLADAALFEADFERAAASIEAFVMTTPTVAALLKLVDVYVDAGFDDRLPVVQRQLAEACVQSGQTDQARMIAEDLFFREPGHDAHLECLRQALAASGVADVESELARLYELAPLFRLPSASPSVARAREAPAGDLVEQDPGAVIEIDLSDALAELTAVAARDEHAGHRAAFVHDSDHRGSASERDQEQA